MSDPRPRVGTPMSQPEPRPTPPPDIYDRIRAALPTARRLLAEGIDNAGADFDPGAPIVEGLSDEQNDQLVAATEHTYIVGVAVGLLLDPIVVLATERRRVMATKSRTPRPDPSLEPGA